MACHSCTRCRYVDQPGYTWCHMTACKGVSPDKNSSHWPEDLEKMNSCYFRSSCEQMKTCWWCCDESLTWNSQTDSMQSSIFTIGAGCKKPKPIHSRVALCHIWDCQSADIAVTGLFIKWRLCVITFFLPHRILLCYYKPEWLVKDFCCWVFVGAVDGDRRSSYSTDVLWLMVDHLPTRLSENCSETVQNQKDQLKL